MIISLRGTSGSGKSHLARQVMALYDEHAEVFAPGRMRPLYTIHSRGNGGTRLWVPGHYDIANGGIDTLRSLDEAYDIAARGSYQGFDVLMEGKNMSDGAKRVNEMHLSRRDVRIVHLCTPLSICVASVRARGHNIKPESIARTHEKCLRDFERFTCMKFMGSREQCLATVRQWLEV